MNELYFDRMRNVRDKLIRVKKDRELTYKQIADAAGLSDNPVKTLYDGTGNISSTSLERIDQALDALTKIEADTGGTSGDEKKIATLDDLMCAWHDGVVSVFAEMTSGVNRRLDVLEASIKYIEQYVRRSERLRAVPQQQQQQQEARQ